MNKKKNQTELHEVRRLVPDMPLTDAEFAEEMRRTTNNVSLRLSREQAVWLVYFSTVGGVKKSTLVKRCIALGLQRFAEERKREALVAAEKLANSLPGGAGDSGGNGDSRAQHGRIVAEIRPRPQPMSPGEFARLWRSRRPLGKDAADEVAAALKELDAAQ